MSNIIQSLWIGGSLSKMEQLSAKSFIDNDEIKTINEFISEIGRKRKMKITFPVEIFIPFLKFLSTLNLWITKITSKQGKLDKLLTFFSKDDVYLSGVLNNQNEKN